MECRALSLGLVKIEKIDVCRLCMVEHEYCLSVFLANDVSMTSLVEVIRDLLNLEVSEGDGLPGTACGQCVEKLMEFRKFKEMCIHSAKELRRHVPTGGGDLKRRCPVKSEEVALGLLDGGGGICCMNVDDESPVPNEACDPLAYDNLCLVNDEGVPMQLVGKEASGYLSYSVDCESGVPVVGNNLSLDPLYLKNETDTEEVYPGDLLGDCDDCPEEDTEEGECNEDAVVCSELIPFVVGYQGEVKEESEFCELVDKGGSHDKDGYEGYSSVTGGPSLLSDPSAARGVCLVNDEGEPMQLLGKEASRYQSYSVDCESGVPMVGNDLSLDPLSLKNETDAEEVYPRDPLGDYGGCPEEYTAEGEFNEDAAACSELIPFVVGDQGEVKEETEFPELVSKEGIHRNDGYEDYSSVTGGTSLSPVSLAAMGMVDHCNNIGGLTEEPETESLKFEGDRQGILQNQVLDNPSCNSVCEENLQLEGSPAKCFVGDCFPERTETKQRKNVQSNVKERPLSNREREHIYHQAENTSYLTDYICNYCSTRYSEKNSLALHIKTHVDENKSASVLPKKDFPPRFSQNLLVNDRGIVKSVILETSNISFTRKSSRRKNEKPAVEQSSVCKNLGRELSNSRMLSFKSVKPREKAEFVCDTCGRAFLKKSDLVKHINVHAGLNPFHCRFCGEKLISKGKLNGHKVMHTGLERLKCNRCGKECSAYRYQQKRVVTHTNLKSFKCDLCGKNFKNATSLKRHSVTHTGVKSFKCNECGKLFTQKSNLNMHSVVHTGVKPFTCNECGMKFPRSSDLKKHLVVHTDAKPFKCNECGKMFAQRRYLHNHSVVHTGAKPFKCNECGKMFTRNGDLKIHSVVHTGVKPFMCNECGKLFARSKDLKTHSSVHTGVKKFKCNECGKMFSSRSDISRHLLVHTGVRPFKCDECGKMFTTRGSLNEHSVVHTGVKPYKCNECGRMFTTRCNLKTHSRIHSGLKPFKCDICGKQFKWKTDFNSHIHTHADRNPSN